MRDLQTVSTDMTRYDPVQHGAHCHVCPLQGNAVVPPAPATSRLKLILVGEGPGRVEERQKAPFVGPSGKFLDQLLGDFPRRNIHITNATLCRGELENEMKTAEVCCAPRLLRELAGLDAATPIGVLGKSAAKSVLGTRSILLARGFVWTVKDPGLSNVKALRTAYLKTMGYHVVKGEVVRRPKGTGRRKPSSPEAQVKARLKWLVLKWRRRLRGRTVFPTIHPAFVMRADTWKPLLQLDMARMLRAARGETLVLRDQGPYAHVRTAKEFKEAVKGMGPVVGADIETDGINALTTKMLCLGLSDGKMTVVIDPRKETGAVPRWSAVLVRVIQKFLETRAAVVMHNGYNFDQIVMRQHGFAFTNEAQ